MQSVVSWLAKDVHVLISETRDSGTFRETRVFVHVVVLRWGEILGEKWAYQSQRRMCDAGSRFDRSLPFITTQLALTMKGPPAKQREQRLEGGTGNAWVLP